MCLLRFELGVLTNGRLGTVELVSEYIKHDQAEEVLVNELIFIKMCLYYYYIYIFITNSIIIRLSSE